MSCPKMPEELKAGAISGRGGGHISEARTWSKAEVDWMVARKEEGYSRAEIADAMDRTEVSVQIKLKRLSKKKRTYNVGHVDEKYLLNRKYIEKMAPKTILDVYAGGCFYNEFPDISTTTNDIDENALTDYHLDSLKLLCKIYLEQGANSYDIVDLDPFGSAYDCFDLAVKIAKKGIIVTFGELGHRRWKRLDYVRRYYGIQNLDDLTLEPLIQKLRETALRNKKDIEIIYSTDWGNIGRVWCKFKSLIITEQWDKK